MGSRHVARRVLTTRTWKLFELHKLTVVPRTLQQPTPPMHQVVDGHLAIQYAAENDMGAMMWIPPTDALKPRFELYRDKKAAKEQREVKLGEGVSLVRDMFCAESKAEAKRLGRAGHCGLPALGLPLARA